MLNIMNRSILEDKLAQPLKTNNKQFKNAFTLFTGYKGIFNNTE